MENNEEIIVSKMEPGETFRDPRKNRKARKRLNPSEVAKRNLEAPTPVNGRANQIASKLPGLVNPVAREEKNDKVATVAQVRGATITARFLGAAQRRRGE